MEKQTVLFLKQEPGNAFHLLLLKRKTKTSKQTKLPHPTKEVLLGC